MTKLSDEQLIKYGFKYIKLKKYESAIKLFYRVLKSNPNEKIKINAYQGLGDAFRAEYEIALAEKMYNRALILAELLEDTQAIKLLDNKIENIYVFKKERELNPVQIGPFMRSIMKLLSFLGKTDWF